MTGKILIVDSIPTNRIVLRVKLASAYYEIVQAASARDALQKLRVSPHDLVIVSSNLPDMNGPRFCASLRRLPQAKGLPVIALLPAGDPVLRRACLLAGADDVLSRPVDDLILLARIRSLLRARDAEAELAMEDGDDRQIGLSEEAACFEQPAKILMVPLRGHGSLSGVAGKLRNLLPHRLAMALPDDLLRANMSPPDVIVIAEATDGPAEGLSLLPQLRANASTRHAALYYLAMQHQRQEVAAAFDMGAGDGSNIGFDPEELAIRLRRLVAQKRRTDHLRASLRDGLRAAVTDPLTGLHNRRYALPHLERLHAASDKSGQCYAILMVDIDHFKAVNDTHGHAAGDAILAELSSRMRKGLRPADLLARHGGEEFLIALPEASRQCARDLAERLCRIVSERPFALPAGSQTRLTISIGVAMSGAGGLGPDALIEMADRALYAAKDAGRNTVFMSDKVVPLRGGQKSGTRRTGKLGTRHPATSSG